MVKFSKQLEGQLVPEWRAAYVSYKMLKKCLKQIKEIEQERRGKELGGSQLYRSFRRAGASRRASSFSRVQESLGSFVALAGNKVTRRSSSTKPVIQVNKVDGDSWELYETVLLDPTESHGSFFTKLDSEFNKVNHFYRSKETEFIEHEDVLEKQMQALDAMHKAFSEQQKRQPLATRSLGNEDNQADDCADLEEGRVQSGSVHPMEIDARGTNSFQSSHDGLGAIPENEFEETRGESSEIRSDGSSSNTKTPTPQMAMRMRIPKTTPATTISMLSQTLWEDVVKMSSSQGNKEKVAEEFVVTKKKIQLAEKMLREAFVEYYRGLGMLKSYSSLNMVAFAKILKKYDKISGQRATSSYLKAVEASYFNTSVEVIRRMDKVETLFTKYFTNYNRRKAMMSLRPRQKRASHYVTFSLGLFVGGSLALLAVFSVLVHELLPKYRTVDPAPGSEAQPGQNVYFGTIFPAFSFVALILLHMYMYGVTLYFWRQMRINYAFIFEFQPGTELRHREVLMVTSILTTLLMGAMVGQLILHESTLSPLVDLIPFFLVVTLLILLVCPFNIFYRSSRVFLLTALLHTLCSPLYKVVLADFFLADQLTSQVPMLRNLEFVLCYYLGGYFRTGRDKCSGNNAYVGLMYLVSLLPYWWRLMQCARRFFDEADYAHIANGGKYLSALVAVAIRIEYVMNRSTVWMAMFIVSSAVATIYQLYWDLVVDWGLLRRQSSNPWLRDQLIMPKKKYLYFLSMALNVVLRLAWLQSVTLFSLGGLNQTVTDFLFASLEIIRRGQWSFYRLENEHLYNVGKYRATKTVPLPFEDPAEGEDE